MAYLPEIARALLFNDSCCALAYHTTPEQHGKAIAVLSSQPGPYMPTKNGPDRDRLNKTITVYGRNPVIEALSDDNLHIDRVHLADSNKPGGAIQSIEQHCARRGVEIVYHSRKELSRISRNGRQDQGTAADIYCPSLHYFDEWIGNQQDAADSKLIVLDGLTNPQNIGMTIRSCYAAGVDAILIPARDLSTFNPLLIKASAGTAFRAPLLYSRDLTASLQELKERGLAVYCLTADAELGLFDARCPTSGAFVVGNESEGVSESIRSLCDNSISIPMMSGVESLNVAVSAALVAFKVCQGR